MNWNDEVPFRGITWASYHVAKIAPNVLHLRDNLSETTEVLEFKDDVVLWSFKYGYLLIASQSQCLIHKENGWNSPVTVELRDKCPQFIKQTERFLQPVSIFSFLITLLRLFYIGRPQFRFFVVLLAQVFFNHGLRHPIRLLL